MDKGEKWEEYTERNGEGDTQRRHRARGAETVPVMYCGCE